MRSADFGNNQLNFTLRRQVSITERLNMQFRANFFNIFNHPSFADPSGSLGSVGATGAVSFSRATFGQSLLSLNNGLGTGGQLGGFNPLSW
jgi:hypothetical protein